MGHKRSRSRSYESVHKKSRKHKSSRSKTKRKDKESNKNEEIRKRRRDKEASIAPSERRNNVNSENFNDTHSNLQPPSSASQATAKNSTVNNNMAKKSRLDATLTKAGGAYIPPAKLKMLQQQMSDKNSEEYQRLAWEHLKKRIHGTINKVNVDNIVNVVKELLKENIIRGKGLFARSVIQAQAASPMFSDVFAALVAVINSKFPHIGELVIRRLSIQFKKAIIRSNKTVAIAASKFIAHLTNQQVVHELLCLEILTFLLENATENTVEVAIALIKECGAKLTELTPRGVDAIFTSFRTILNESEVGHRMQYMIEVLFQVRKDKFSAHPAMKKELDLIEEEDQITHTIALDDAVDPENMINVFRFDPDFEKNEKIYEELKKEIFGEDDDDEADDSEEGDDDGEQVAEEGGQPKTVVIDNTESNLIALRRTIYLAIQSSLTNEEAAHKLMKMTISPELEIELSSMVLDCCAQNRSYEKFYGLLASNFCRVKKDYQLHYEQLFKDTYDTIHRLELPKVRNITRFFAHLLFSDSISWMVLSQIKLNERDTTSSGRVFIKILFQELAEILGLEKLFSRTKDPTMQEAFDGLFPRDDPQDTRFSINFFTSIGLGGLTADLREHLARDKSDKQVVNLTR